MKILVTGAAGFIGSHASIALLQRGHQVTGIDNFDPYYSVDLKQRNVRIIRDAGANFSRVDVLDRTNLSELLKHLQPEVILHLAAKAGVRKSEEDASGYFETNTVGTINLMDAALGAGCTHMVMASTSSVYGNQTGGYFREELPADHPLQPYAASKRSAEMIAEVYFQLYGFEVTVARLFTVYGPRGRPDMMPYLLLESILTGKEVPFYGGLLARDWTYVSDIVDGLVLACEIPLGFEILNLGRGEPVTLQGFIDVLELTAGSRPNLATAPMPKSEMLTTHADISKARRLLGFNPKVGVEDGIEMVWKWYSSIQASSDQGS